MSSDDPVGSDDIEVEIQQDTNVTVGHSELGPSNELMDTSKLEEKLTSEEGRQEIRRLLKPAQQGRIQAPRFDAADLLNEFTNFSRQPFTEVLTELIGAVPSPMAIKDFAEDHPDRWANAIATMSRLAGYHDKLEITGNIAVDIHNMGDAQLMEEIKKINEKLDTVGKKDTLIEQDAPFVEFEDEED